MFRCRRAGFAVVAGTAIAVSLASPAAADDSDAAGALALTSSAG